MNRVFVFCFAILLSMVLLSGGQSNSGPHLCDKLQENNNRIAYTLNVPQKTYFNNYIIIKGFYWQIQFPGGSSGARSKREEKGEGQGEESQPNEVNTQSESSPLNMTVTTLGSSDQHVSLMSMYGKKALDIHNLDAFKCAFAVRYGWIADQSKWDTNLLGLLTADYSKIKWMTMSLKNKPELIDGKPTNGSQIGDITKDGAGGGNDQLPLKNERNRKKRQSYDKSGDFVTKFNESDYEPQVSFSMLSNINEPTFAFIETRLGEEAGTFESRIQGYRITDPEGNWQNLTKLGKNQKFRRRRELKRVVPDSIWDTASKHFIKGVFPIHMEGFTFGSIILIEVCSSNDIPCSGDVSYKYCVVSEDMADPANEGNPCHSSQLQLLFDCNKELETTLPTNDGDSAKPNGETQGSDGPNASDLPPSSTSESEEKSMWWLWIIIVVIIIIVIISIILCLFCCKGKGSQEAPSADAAASGAVEGAAEGTSDRTSSSGSGSAKTSPSPVGSKVDRKSSGSGLSNSPSTASTVSTRSSTV